jgi:hypothetical protein
MVVAAALLGAQHSQLVAGAERDDRQAGMDPRVLAGAERPQQPARVRRALKLAEEQHVDRTGRQPRAFSARRPGRVVGLLYEPELDVMAGGGAKAPPSRT